MKYSRYNSILNLSNSFHILYNALSDQFILLKESAKAVVNVDVYKAIATGTWKKEDELRTLKSQAAELDRRIALTLAPVEENDEGKDNKVEEQKSNYHSHSSSTQRPFNSSTNESKSQENTTEKEVFSRVIIARPKLK